MRHTPAQPADPVPETKGAGLRGSPGGEAPPSGLRGSPGGEAPPAGSPGGAQPPPGSAPTPGFTSPDVQMALVLGAAGFHLGALGVIIVLLSEDLGVPVSSLAWMGSIFGVALLAAALVGPVVLRWGANRVLATCTTLSAVGFALLALAPTLPLVAVGAALQAVGGSGTVLVVPTLLTGPRADIRVTRVNAVSSVVSVASPLMIGALIAAGLNGRLSLLLAAVPMLVVAVVAARAGRSPAPAVQIPPGAASSAGDTPADAGDTPADAGDRTQAHAIADTVGHIPAAGHTPAHPATPADAHTKADTSAGTSLSKRLVLRRWLAIVVAVSAEFSFLIWAVARLVDSGLDTGLAATVGAAFPIGMAVGRVLGTWVIAHLPAVPVGAGVASVGTVLVVLGPTWPVIAAGLVLAGLGIATFYPVTLVNLMGVPRLPQSVASSLGALASGTAITLAPAGLALLGSVVELRLAYLVVLPLLGALVLLHGRGH